MTSRLTRFAAGHLNIQTDVSALLEVGLLGESIRAYISTKKAESGEGPGRTLPGTASFVEQFLVSLMLCALPTMILWQGRGQAERSHAPTWIMEASDVIITSLGELLAS